MKARKFLTREMEHIDLRIEFRKFHRHRYKNGIKMKDEKMI